MIEQQTVSELSMVLAKRLTALRLQRAWTRDVLAEESDVNVHSLKRFELTGQISLERLLKLCAALDVLDECKNLLKPRQRIDIHNWNANQVQARKRGRRKTAKQSLKDAAGN